MSVPAPPALLPRLQVLAAAALFSTGGAAIKATSLSAWQVASFRSGVAALVLALIFFRRSRGDRDRSRTRRATPRVLAVGLAYAGALCSYVVANKLTTAAGTIFLVSTSPLWILLLSPWWLGESVRRRDLGLIAALAVGMVLVFVSPNEAVETASNPSLGNWVAAGSGFVWALTVIGLRSLGRSGSAEGIASTGSGASATAAGHAVVWGNFLCFALVLPLALPVTQLAPLDVGVVVYLGVIQIALAYVLLLAGLRHVPALEASLLLILEPVLNPLWAWLLHSEVPAATTSIGGVVIVTALAVHSWLAVGRRPSASGGQ